MNRMTLPNLPIRLMDLTVRLYAALLVLYPAAYRNTYGPPMIQVFRDCARDAARRGGSAGVLQWTMWAGLDLLVSALAERRRAPLRWSRAAARQGLLLCLIAGGLCFAIAGISQLQPGSHYAFRGIYQASISFLYPGFILLALGTAALAWDVWRQASPLARLMVGAACLGMSIACLVMLAGALIPGEESWAWHLGMLGFILHFAGLGILGVISLRTGLLPRWNVVPVLMSLLFFSMWLLNPGGDVYGPKWGAFLLFASLGAGYGLIGFSLWRAHRARPATSPMLV